MSSPEESKDQVHPSRTKEMVTDQARTSKQLYQKSLHHSNFSSSGSFKKKLEPSVWINLGITVLCKEDKDMEIGPKKQSLPTKDPPRCGNESHSSHYNEVKEG